MKTRNYREYVKLLIDRRDKHKELFRKTEFAHKCNMIVFNKRIDEAIAMAKIQEEKNKL